MQLLLAPYHARLVIKPCTDGICVCVQHDEDEPPKQIVDEIRMAMHKRHIQPKEERERFIKQGRESKQMRIARYINRGM